MSTRSARPFALGDIVRVLFRHKRKLGVWCLLVVSALAVVLLAWPRKYESSAKLFVRLGRESVSLDPSANTGPTVQVQETRENQINSARDMLASRELLERVVADLGPDLILNGPPGAQPTGVAALVAWLRGLVPTFEPGNISPTEKAIEKLSTAIKVATGRNSSVIGIDCRASSPALAQQILSKFLEAYRAQHLSANRTSGSQDFFVAQTSLLKQELDRAVAKLRDAKTASGLVSIPVEQQALQTQLVQVEAAALAADSSLAAAEASIASLTKSLTVLPEQLESQQVSGYPNVAADSMRNEFYKLQISLRDLEARLTPDHPQVRTVRDQVKQAEKILAEQEPKRVQMTTGVNPSRQAIELDLRREESTAASLKAKSAKLKAQYAQLQERLARLNEQEVQIADLERQVSIAETNYRANSGNLEQARIGQALEDKQISNVNVVQPPSLVAKPVSPQPMLIVALGMVVLFGGSFAIAFGSEFLEQPPKAPEVAHQRTWDGIQRPSAAHAPLAVPQI